MHTHLFGLSVRVVLQLAEEGVLLRQQHFDVVHAHSDYPGADVRLQSVNALAEQRRTRMEDIFYSCAVHVKQINKFSHLAPLLLADLKL